MFIIVFGFVIVVIFVGFFLVFVVFVVGMIIGEGDVCYVVENEIWFFCDLFVGIFFVGIGM